MYAQADKQKNNHKTENKQDAQKELTADSPMQFQDKRPEYTMLSNLQDVADNSHQSKNMTQLREMSDKGGAAQEFPAHKRENTTGLPDGLKSGVENLSGYSLNDVKVHYNSGKPAQLQAHAYAQGTDIHVAPGQEKHLPHEAWHVIQQKQGRVQPTTQLKGKVAINDDTSLEKEADVMGEKAVQFVQTDETETHQNKSAQSGQVAQLQTEGSVSEAETDEDSADDAELKALLDALSVFSMSDVEITDEPESGGEEEESSPDMEVDDSEEEIQLFKNTAVIQALRKPPKKNKKYYKNKLAKSYFFLMRVRGLMDAGYVRLDGKQEIKQLHDAFKQTIRYFDVLSNQELDSDLKQTIDRLTFLNTRIYYRTIRKIGGPMNLSPEIRFFLGLYDSGAKKSVLVDWYNEIKSKNEYILELIRTSDDPRSHPWFMMDYEDIVDSQADQANEAIEAGINDLMIQKKGNLDDVKDNILHLVTNGVYYLPLVRFKNAWIHNEKEKENDEHSSQFIAVDYEINPSYTKYVDPTKTGHGSQAIQILGDSKDDKVKTDIRFIPGSLTVGDETSQVGIQMEAVRLSQDSPLGSEAGKDSSQDDMMGNLEKVMGDKRTKYIKGHLLNDHLGGPARPYNLFPITDQANSDHLVFMEKYVKAEVEEGYVMYYKVNIANHTVTDRKPSQKGHARRYSVNADIQCESAKFDPSEKKIEEHKITVKSVWSGGEVLDSTGSRIRRKSDGSSTGSALATHADYTRKLTSGKADEGVTNPDVKSPDAKKHLIHKKGGYNQNAVHKGKLSDSDLTSKVVSGAIPFSISGDRGELSTALEPAVASTVGKHIAKLIWASSFITGGKLKAGITEKELQSIKGVGPASIQKLKKNFEIK